MHGPATGAAIIGAVIPALPSRARRRVVALCGAAVLLAGSCTSAVVDDAAPVETLFAEAATPSSTTTAPSSELQLRSAAAGAELPPLPAPEPLPLDEHAPTPEVTLGRIRIPALGLDEPLHQGMTLTAINRGPSQWPGTALPGQVGNMVIAGHRTTYSQPFLDLDLVQVGDEMVVETHDGARHTYVATATEVVEPDALWIAEQSHGFTATTFACHPKGSARQRIVVRWQLVDHTGTPVAPLA